MTDRDRLGADLVSAARKLVKAVDEVRTGLGMTAYEGTPVSVWSALHYEAALGEALREIRSVLAAVEAER